ncbi:MAG: CotH kinase family protein [Flavobacteriaceae bacterium]
MKNLLLFSVFFGFIMCSNEVIPENEIPPAEEITRFDGPSLPRIKINTNGTAIVDEPKIRASFEIIENEEVIEAYNIGIEIRGSSSQMFEKKSYGFETWDENNEDINVPLAGFPKEEDWILYGPYSDKTLIRNVLIYALSNQMGQYATRTKFYELEINSKFLGTYVLMEKIKRDKNRVAISKNKPEDISGGYILKIDKPTGDGDWYNENIAFGSQYTPQGTLGQFKNVAFLYEYPDADDINETQKTYIQNYIHGFETALLAESFADQENGYRQFIDLDSFIDFFILNELSKNPDGFRLSTYIHKDKGKKLKMGPIWDFNIAFGNVNYCNGDSPQGWAHHFNDLCSGDTWLVPFWWKRFLEDPAFVQMLQNRWNTLRKSTLETAAILRQIDQYKDTLESRLAIQQNFAKWRVLGTYVWPNAFIGSNYSEEVNYLKQWIEQRISWMDETINGL